MFYTGNYFVFNNSHYWHKRSLNLLKKSPTKTKPANSCSIFEALFIQNAAHSSQVITRTQMRELTRIKTMLFLG